MKNNIYFKDKNNNDYIKYTKKEIREKIKPSEKDYKEIILFLLNALEDEHMGIKDFYIQEIQNKYNIDF